MRSEHKSGTASKLLNADQIVSNPFPLDPTLYSLSPEAEYFFKSVTRITDDNELKAHILTVQEKAYKVASYPCIHRFLFLRPSVMENPVYHEVIKIGRERAGAIFLDVGSCFGVDARRVAFDGFPSCNIVTTDVMSEFFELGHVLFRSSKETYPAPFVHGDALDPNILAITSPCSETPSSPPDLTNLTSLNPLRGYCSVIHASGFFHVFTEERQLHLARAFAGLLSPAPGSIICGRHAVAREKGLYTSVREGKAFSMFCHSPQSWIELWDGVVFEKGQVEVKAKIRDQAVAITPEEGGIMVWSVTRL